MDVQPNTTPQDKPLTLRVMPSAMQTILTALFVAEASAAGKGKFEAAESCGNCRQLLIEQIAAQIPVTIEI